VELRDAPWDISHYFGSKELHFLTIDEKEQEAAQNYFPWGPGIPLLPLFSVKFRLSPKTQNYERNVYTVLNMLGDIGGFNDALVIICTLLTSQFVPAFFAADFIQSAFKLDPTKPKPNEPLI